jgi:hypothetical protein
MKAPTGDGAVHSRRRARLLVGVRVMLLALAQMAFVACESHPSSNKETAQPSQPIKSEESKQISPDSAEFSTTLRQLVELQGMVMTRSEDRIISGKDLRPLYLVEGRINNRSNRDITEVSIRISILKGDNEVDGCDISIESLVPAGAVRSFRKQIQVVPPKSGMKWTYEVTEVRGG